MNQSKKFLARGGSGTPVPCTYAYCTARKFHSFVCPCTRHRFVGMCVYVLSVALIVTFTSILTKHLISAEKVQAGHCWVKDSYS